MGKFRIRGTRNCDSCNSRLYLVTSNNSEDPEWRGKHKFVRLPWLDQEDSLTKSLLRWLLPVCSILMGVVYIQPKECMAQPWLAPVLMVLGVFGILNNSLWMYYNKKPRMAGIFFKMIVLVPFRFIHIAFNVLIGILWYNYDVTTCNPALFYYCLYLTLFINLLGILAAVCLFYEQFWGCGDHLIAENDESNAY